MQSGFNGANLRVVGADDEKLIVVTCLNLGLLNIGKVSFIQFHIIVRLNIGN